MNLTPWKKHPSLANTTSPMSELQKEINHLFGRFFGETSSFFEPFMAFPLVSVCENDKALTVTAEIPGIAADELDVRVDGNVLTIRGEKKDEKKDEKDDMMMGGAATQPTKGPTGPTSYKNYSPDKKKYATFTSSICMCATRANRKRRRRN